MTMTAGVQLAHTAPRLQTNGADVSMPWNQALLRVRIERGLRTIGRAVLVFADPGHKLAQTSAFALGSDAAVLASDGKGYFKGLVASRALDVADGEVTLVITLHDKATLLIGDTLTTTSTTATVADVAKELVMSAGLTLDGPGGVATRLNMPWLGLTGNALAVIDEIAGRYGYDWQVDDRKLQMWDAATGAPSGAPSASLAVGRDLRDFSVEVTNAYARTHEVRAWNGADLRSDSSRAQTQSSRGASSWLPALGKVSTQIHPGGDTVDAAEGAAMAAALAGTGRRVRARGRALMNPGVAPGGSVEITGSGPTDGTYYVREVEHVWDTRGSWTRFVAGDRDAPRLADSRQPAPASTFVHPHLTIGVVTEVGDEHEDAAQREPTAVKVKLPLLDDLFGSTWARLALPGAGQERGLLATPAVNDEVLVAFVDGDQRRPVVIGGLYGPRKKPRPTKLVQSRAAATHLTSHTGHVVELSDGQEPAKQHVALRLGNGDQFIRLGKDKVEVKVPANVPLRLGNDQAYIEINGGKITISGQDIVVEAKNSAKIDATTVGIAAKATATVEGKTTLTLKAAGTAGLEASGPLSLKGAIVRIN